jgi:predicted ribosomally synthesized peptide with SipW-like signal peptide
MEHGIIKSMRKIAAVLALMFLAVFTGKIEGTNSFFSNQEKSPGNSFTAGTWAIPGEIVINEILPNPTGADNQDKDHSEFVELYNRGGSSIDLNGWRIYAGDSYFIEINNITTDGKGTVIDKGKFLVVWFYKKWNESKMNNSGESISLYTAIKSTGKLIDKYTYPSSADNKSSARFPDGTNNWVDPIPTPGEPNKLEEEAVVEEPTTKEIPPAESETEGVAASEEAADASAEEPAIVTEETVASKEIIPEEIKVLPEELPAKVDDEMTTE